MTKKRILVIDDSPLILEATSVMLQQAGFEVTTLDDPTQVLEAVQRGVPDVILVDVRMPQMTGPAVTRALKRLNEMEGTPIVLHSDLPVGELDRCARLCGASGYIQKGHGFESLISQVKSWAGRRRVRAE